MPRTKGDHEARRREVSEAVWRVLAARGFGGLTLRAVAAELRASTGLLTHYFPTKRDLIAYALDLLETRTAARRRESAGGGAGAAAVAAASAAAAAAGAADGGTAGAGTAGAGTAGAGTTAADTAAVVEAPAGFEAVRDALLAVLPLGAEAATSNRIWVSSWEPALADAELSADYARKYGHGRDRLRGLIAEAQERGEVRLGDAARLAEGAQSFVLGLTVQALFDPAAFPPKRQVELVDDYLAGLRVPTATVTE